VEEFREVILAGDIGGTHARLAFFDVTDGDLRLLLSAVYPSQEFSGLDQIVARFVATSSRRPDAACFGVAGPVHDGRVRASNLPWVVESQQLADELKIRKAIVINDLEANAWGIAALAGGDVVALNPVQGSPVGNQAVIAAGTGLGEAGMYWDGSQYHVFACEGGHADFAPRNELETELFGYLQARFGHVSYERVASGPGLVNVYRFLRDSGRGAEPQWLVDEMSNGDPAAAISHAGVEGKCPLCEQAVDIFVSVYAAEAGNLALKLMATGGVYLGGGISPKMLPKLSQPQFMQAFTDKGRLRGLMESIPVRVIVNDQAALLGAARCALAKGKG
jgi:glucokinase